ncbi:hypothetical protein LCGC14_0406790 [marine sediment metagenome]|uniref:Uncharacterized protein n=1 Tax=marine sediment metagenome TaxID=412755 RepID=A0A0F9T0P5_9ZZZZ
MNYEQALQASKCNPAEVMKVLERLEWECNRCNGKGILKIPEITLGTRLKKTVNCSHCVKGKLSYSWTPQVGEFSLLEGKVFLVKEKPYECGKSFYKLHEDAIPILEWEVIEEILEKAGYELEIIRGKTSKEFFIGIHSLDYHRVSRAMGCAKSRQQAVMKAVIELGKEQK